MLTKSKDFNTADFLMLELITLINFKVGWCVKGFALSSITTLWRQIWRFCLQAFAMTQSGVSMHMIKRTHKTPITLLCFLYTGAKQHSKVTCPLEFIFQGLPKTALSKSLQVAGKQNREKKSTLGWETAHKTLFWGGGEGGPYDLRRNPLCTQGNSKRNPASPTLCPTPDP